MDVQLLNHFGTDADICSSARVSYNNRTVEKTDKENQRLLDYLAVHGHASPFEQSQYRFFMRVPLFVFGQIVRHRTASINCKSYRYTEVDDFEEFFIPDEFRRRDEKKQGSSDEIIENNDVMRELCQQKCANDLKFYKLLLENKICREQARIFLPQNLFTEFVWSIDFRNLFHFIRLRSHHTAQKEIRFIAEKLYEIARRCNPMACNAMHLSEKVVTKAELGFIIRDDIESIPSKSRREEVQDMVNQLRG